MASTIPDLRYRAQLVELMDEPCSREEMRACLIDLARTNRWTMAYRPILRWLDWIISQRLRSLEPFRILDVGCGYGDGLRRIEQWATARGIAVDLIGLDRNSDAIAIAAEASPRSSKIRWVNADALAFAPQQTIHFVVSSQFTHHLSQEDIVQFLRWMEQHAEQGWFICDLFRASIPYFAFRVFAKLAGLHRFVQCDGPASIARSFVPDEWRRMCAMAGLRNDEVLIQCFNHARLCVAREK